MMARVTRSPAGRPRVARPRRAVLVLTLVLLLLALLLPTGYAFARMWQTTGDDTEVGQLERVGVAYLRPLDNLLVALADAQSSAARGQVADAGAVRAAIEEVSRVDHSHGDELFARQRWAPLPDQIESALTKSGPGADALNSYAVPVGLAQTLLEYVGGTSGALRDTDLVAYQLAEGALILVPDVIVNASRIVGLARTKTGQTTAIAVAQNRIDKAAGDLGNGLQLANDVNAGEGGLAQLKQVDNFTATVQAMIKASSAPSLSTSAALAEVDAAESRLQKAASALAGGLLSDLDSLLERRANGFNQEHQRILIAASLATVAAACLVWTCLVVVGRRRAAYIASDPRARARKPEPEEPDRRQRAAGTDAENGPPASRGAPVPQGSAGWR